tara:strand:- start:196 stop:684 length:489 start_codon:yes stop_codon:yes gene_type:complete
MLTLDSSCGCYNDEIAENAVALYGVRAIYYRTKECGHGFDLVPTFAQLVAKDDETKESFRSLLEGKDGCIVIARRILEHHEDFTMATEEDRPIMAEPMTILDLGRFKFYAKRVTGYIYLTWALYNAPINFEEAERISRILKIINWRKEWKLTNRVTKWKEWI